MYLQELTDDQKNLALDILIGVANANHYLEDSEKKLIEAYCKEMDIAPVRYEAKLNPEEAEQKFLSVSDRTDCRKMLIAVTAMAIADNTFDDLERAFVKKFLKAAEISKEEFSIIYDYLEKINGLQEKLRIMVYNS